MYFSKAKSFLIFVLFKFIFFLSLSIFGSLFQPLLPHFFLSSASFSSLFSLLQPLLPHPFLSSASFSSLFSLLRSICFSKTAFISIVLLTFPFLNLNFSFLQSFPPLAIFNFSTFFFSFRVFFYHYFVFLKTFI